MAARNMSAAPMAMKSVTIQSDSEQQTVALAAAIAAQLRGGDVIGLEGLLGSGKTCFVRGLAAGLGIDAALVSSPTFVIRHEYSGGAGGGGGATLVHIDAYRLAGSADLETIGWSELLSDRRVIIAVEWPSRIAAALPKERIDIAFEHVGEHSRVITIAGPAMIVDAVGGQGPSTTGRAKCRTCGRAVDASAVTFPFCSDRCRLSDLGRWFNESYRTSRAAESDEELSE